MKQPVNSIEDIVAGRMCHGCGACLWACPNDAIMLLDFPEDGIRPVRDAGRCDRCGRCLEVCSGAHLSRKADSRMIGASPELARSWGPVLELWEGFANDEQVRFRGSSGGVATALGIYCIERRATHGVLHAGADDRHPFRSMAVVSRNRDDLVARAGSRYAPVAVCGSLGVARHAPGPMAMIAKPCEVASARNACRMDPELNEKMDVFIAVFCGGTPAIRGTLRLLERLKTDPKNITELRYRGCGWPGNFSAEFADAPGQRREIGYQEAWDEVLAKHRPFRCLMCPDGTGEYADISCGDPWYRADRDSSRGSTLIVVRSEKGRDVLLGAIRDGFVTAQRRENDVLERSQHGLLMRRRHVWPKLVAWKLAGLPAPRFRCMSLLRDWSNLPAGRKFVSLYRGARMARWHRKMGPAVLDPSEGNPLTEHEDAALKTA